MGTHYLVDLYGNPVSSSSIIDVREPPNGQSITNGTFVIRVPDGAAVQKPANFADLITKKYAGLLGFYAGFTRITFDDLIDASAIDAVNSSKIAVGERMCISLFPGGTLQSVVVPLTPGAPAQVLLTWETFQFTSTDLKTDRYERTYAEVPSTPLNITCSVSFNGGVNYNTTTDGAVLNIPGGQQGTNFIIRLTNASANRLYLGSWAVIY